MGSSLMLFQLVLPFEADGAALDLAAERFLTAVSLLVASQLARLDKSFRALGTLEVAVPVVGSHVGLEKGQFGGQVLAVGEMTAVNITLVQSSVCR